MAELRTLLAFIFFFSFIVLSPPGGFINAQELIPPARFDGFVYKDRPSTRIMIEAFLDPVCPDSRNSWPPLKQAVDHYGSQVSLIVHPFPLPYHDNAFVSSRALHIANKLNASATYDLLELFFKQQEVFYSQATFNMSRANIVNQIVKLATKTVGSSYQAAVTSGFMDRKTDLLTRVSFKYGCSRGVFGAPTFFVNGFALHVGESTMDYAKWRSIIDPLLK